MACTIEVSWRHLAHSVHAFVYGVGNAVINN